MFELQEGLIGIRNLSIRDFRCFRQLSFELNTRGRTLFRRDLSGESARVAVAPLTVFVAKNGMGKTAILDAIRILYGTFTSAFDSNSKVSAKTEDIRLYRKEDDALTQAKSVSFSGEVLIDGRFCHIERELDAAEGARTTTGGVRVLADFGKKLRQARETVQECEWPVLAFYGTGRLWVNTRDGERRRSLLKKEDFGYENCLGHSHNFKSVNDWLTKAIRKRSIDTADNLKHDETMERQLEAITKAIGVILQEEGYRPELTIESMTESLAIKAETSDHQFIPVPISQLSDGVKAAFGLAADIAFRCAKLNPMFGAAAAERTRGLVMIDEVDMHLHPSWQQKIVNALQLAFPRIQFLITTHSPQVVSSVPAECVREISAEGIESASIQTEGAKSSQVLEDVFGVSSRVSAAISKVSSDLEEYRRLVEQDRWDSDRARELKLVLEEVLGSDPELTELALEVQLRDYQRRHADEAHR